MGEPNLKKKAKTAVFIQCRLDSTRLPRKALFPIGPHTLLEWAFKTLIKLKVDHYVLLTTSDSAFELAPLAEKWGFEIFEGSKENVLERFVLAARQWEIQTLVRATGDNPLVSLELAQRSLEHHLVHQPHYTAMKGAPVGTGVEVVQSQTLETALSSSPNLYEKEHVCPFLYNRPNQFQIDTPQVPEAWKAPELRLTVDTQTDFQKIQDLYIQYPGFPLTLSELVHHYSNKVSSHVL